MPQTKESAYAKRQAQWNAFHRWESGKPIPWLSPDDRISWYAGAFAFCRSLSAIPDPNHLREKAALLGAIRQKLACLKRPASHG